MSRTHEEVQSELRSAEVALDELGQRERRLWDRIRIAAGTWTQDQYPGLGPMWVVAVMGQRCLSLNEVEGGWGWGRFDVWGNVTGYHCEQLEIQHVVAQTL